MLKIHCPICRNVFQETDVVLLDFINTLTHVYCYKGEYDSITDKGTYKELTEKYSFLQEVLH
ncbi:hypothetical protein D4T97_001950 [Siminovitchia acidinfaciens]|uniref:Uncharacterized protein n=1 Tax=Siminovitchia acidinfaciens TaxID=2321395 RepID=A0A429Y772_9BACI|nr:hypothetical protein [Siminovitchia acidinfaciens]RST77276.1 hypothetical protein D4T97_001950 [Siminovitchia acidinfaciens]